MRLVDPPRLGGKSRVTRRGENAMAAPQASSTGEGGLPPCHSVWRLWYDLAWAHALIWFATLGRPVSPLPGVHLYFADRYGWLGACVTPEQAVTNEQTRAGP